MSIDKVAAVIARTLGVSSNCISGWELGSRQEGYPGAMGLIRNDLKVRVDADRETLGRLQAGHIRGWRLSHMDVESGVLGVRAQLTIDVLYAKETQLVFEALAKMMVYRKPKRRK